MFTRRRIAKVSAEFLGTALLTLVVLGVSRSTIGLPYFVAIAVGLAVVMAYLVLGLVSGGHFNPAITVGLWSVRRIAAIPAIVYVAAQLLGGVIAYLLFSYLIGQSIPSPNNEFVGRVLVAEAVGGFIFSLGWAATMYHHFDEAKSAAVIGISFMLAIIVAAVGNGGIVNPAVALGAQSWVLGTFVLGPLLGAIIGFNLYSLLFSSVQELMKKAPKLGKL